MDVRSAWAGMSLFSLLVVCAGRNECAGQPPVPASNPSAGTTSTSPAPAATRSNLPPPSFVGTGNASQVQGILGSQPTWPPSAAPFTRVPNGSSQPSAANPLATNLQLKGAPFEATDVRYPINLATALRLSDARPLIV